MVHQHFMLVPVFTVAENIVLGNETMANPVFLDVDKSEGRIRELAEQLGFEVDPDAKVGDLSVGIQQRIEILKALYRGAEILSSTSRRRCSRRRRPSRSSRSCGASPTRARASCSSATSSTRCSGSPTGSRSSGAAGSSGRPTPRRPTEEELAEMMVGREVVARSSTRVRPIQATSCSRSRT